MVVERLASLRRKVRSNMINKDFYTQQKETYSGIYTDNHNNIYDLREYCGYWSLYMRVGHNGHTKTILDNSDLTSCLVELQERGLKRMEENREWLNAYTNQMPLTSSQN